MSVGREFQIKTYILLKPCIELYSGSNNKTTPLQTYCLLYYELDDELPKPDDDPHNHDYEAHNHDDELQKADDEDPASSNFSR